MITDKERRFIVGSISIQSNYSVHLKLHYLIFKSFNRCLLLFFEESNAEVLHDLLHRGSKAGLVDAGGADMWHDRLVGGPELLLAELVQVRILLQLLGELQS